MVKIDEEVLKQYASVIDNPPPSGRQKEQVVQDFLEMNTELIPTPNRLNHQIHFESIISKFPLGTELTTDYVYITKSSDVWRVTLVELESPDKDIFTGDLKKAIFSSGFNAAVAQVRDWKIFLDENRDEFIRRLKPMFRPLGMADNPIEFNFQLIIGRSANKNATQDRKRHIRKIITGEGIEVITYDQLVDWYRNDRRFKKLVLRLSKNQFSFKYMHFLPSHILSYLGPDCLILSDIELEKLKAEGYEMDKWKQGELLTYNTKYALSTAEEEMEDGTFFNFQNILKK